MEQKGGVNLFVVRPGADVPHSATRSSGKVAFLPQCFAFVLISASIPRRWYTLRDFLTSIPHAHNVQLLRRRLLRIYCECTNSTTSLRRKRFRPNRREPFPTIQRLPYLTQQCGATECLVRPHKASQTTGGGKRFPHATDTSSSEGSK
jgi:hypothetical protein